ncbi:MAG: helix-turn-helix domain-containing protein [Prevotella sp.]|nr:helix-turn-helix domain-containing protein [Prevotella sp.]
MHRLLLTLILAAGLLGSGVRAADAGRQPTGRDYAERGHELYEEGKYKEAINDFIHALETADREHDAKTSMRSLGHIGNIYSKLGDYERSVYYHRKGYDLSLQQGDTVMQQSFLSSLVASYCRMGQADKAQAAFEKIDTVFSGASPERKYFMMYNQARIAKARGQLDEALALHQRTLDFARQYIGDRRLQLFQQLEMTNIVMLQGDYERAWDDAQRCFTMATGQGDPEMVATAAALLAEACQMKGDSEASALWRNRYLSITDSLFSKDTFFRASSELMDYENLLNDRHIDRLNSTISQQWLTIIVTLVLVALLLLTVVILVRTNRRLRNAHQLLVRKNRDIMQSEERSRQLRSYVSQNHDLQSRIIEALDDPAVISNPDFSMQMLAESVGSNVKYVSQIINDTYGKTFKTLLNERRIQEACRRLTDAEHYGHLTIQAIYEEVGYTNAASFIRSFRKVNGMTPSEYQKAATDVTASE